jgi:hypothetical protein
MLTCWRRGGMVAGMEPQYASGFGEALSSFLSRGGSVQTDKRGKRFMGTRGDSRLKGMTLDQATEEAKRLWAGASPEIREKYAQRAGVGRLADSERRPWSGPVQTPENERIQGGRPPDVPEREWMTLPDGSGFRARMRPQGGAPEAGGNLPDDGNMDEEIASAWTPEQQAEFAAQLQMGQEFATAGTWGGLNMDVSKVAADAHARAREQAAPQDESARIGDGTLFTPTTAGQGNRTTAFQESNARYAADLQGGGSPNPRRNSAAPAAGNASPTPAAAPPQEDLARKAFEAGYIGNNAVERFKRDHGHDLPELETEQSRAAHQEKFAPQVNPVRPPVNPAIARAEAASRPGAQRQIAQQRIAQRPDGYQARGALEERRMIADNIKKDDERRANTLTMDDVRGLGPMAAWGIDPKTGDQLTRERAAELRGAPSFAGGNIPIPTAQPMQSTRRRPMASRR